MKERSTEAKDVVTLDMLEKLVQPDLRTNMKISKPKARMKGIFSSYHNIFRHNGLPWIVKDNQKIEVAPILSTIQHPPLQYSPELDLAFSLHALRKDFSGFLAHAIKLAEEV